MRYGFAHRGGSQGPDNAIATFAAAVQLGANGIETDAWVTQDGVVVLDHDGVAGRSGREPIAQVRRSELPAHIATLTDLYEAIGATTYLAIDVSSAAIAKAVLAVAQQHNAADKLWLVAPAVSDLVEIEGSHRAVTIRGNVIRSGKRAGVLASARDAGIEAINARWMWWSRALVAEVHALGMLAFGYDAQRRASLDRSLAIGLNGVFSDHVARMIEAVSAAG